MRLFHLDCGSLCPFTARVFPNVFPEHIVCHCLLIETQNHLILVDTGLGLDDMRHPERLGPLRFLLGPENLIERTAAQQVRALGFSPNDVTDIIPTHLDFDHSGGIADFPKARVHISNLELEAARNRSNFRFKARYRNCHIQSISNWKMYDPLQGTEWNGFSTVQTLGNLPPEILLVNLPGHTPGHLGIAVNEGSSWLMHAGDAYYDSRELSPPWTEALSLRLFHKIAHTDSNSARQTQSKLRGLKDRVDVFCSHDPWEFKRLADAEKSKGASKT